MTADGFHPVAVAQRRGCDFVLGRCPFVEVAAIDPATVCQLHLGLVEGIAATLDEGAVVDLVVKDPRQAWCRVRCGTWQSKTPRRRPGTPASRNWPDEKGAGC